MRLIRNVSILASIALSASTAAWSQGGRRGAATQQPPAQQAPAQQGPAQQAAPSAAGRGGRGGAAIGGPATSEFYNYDISAAGGQPIPDSQPAESHQKVTVNGQPLAYTTRAGYLALRNATSGQSEAHLFYTSYIKDGAADDTSRPLLFFVGGGPGVAAAWQEFGGLGPKRMNFEAGNVWAENSGTVLSQADLVFVNPVGTAFSRPDQPSHGPNFWNSAGDVSSLGEFIRTFVARSNRTASPLFLAGEDTGTSRVAGLAGYLNEHQVPVHGMVLLSMSLSADSQAGDTQYLTLLPSLVMTAWYNKKLSPDLNAMSSEQIAGQVRQFASREYLHALYKGERMTADERAKVIADLSRLTGLSKGAVISNNLRISLDRFNSELMRDQHRGFSPSDSRVSGFIPAPVVAGRGGGGGGFGAAAAPAIDFNLSSLGGPFLSTYQSYLRRELGFTANSDSVFYLMGGGVTGYTSSGGDDASLAAAFARNPNLHLFVGVNYFDLNAPFYATEYTLAHLNVSPEVRAHNISVSHFEAGQMAYLDSKELVKLQRDLARFLTEATARK